MFLTLVFAFTQSVQVLDLDEFGLNDIEFKVELLRLFSGHRQSTVQLE